MIVQAIIENYPKENKIKYVRHIKNIGMMPNFISAFQSAKGKFIALFEGVDYWIDHYKLKTQIDFLESNLDYSMCYHPVEIKIAHKFDF